MKRMRWQPAYFGAFLLLTGIEILIAPFVHDAFVRPYLGDILVVVVYCFVRSFLPSYRWLPFGVFLFAAAIEIAQYFDVVARLGLQDHRVLAVMLGTTFDLADLICYFCGFLLLAGWQAFCNRASSGFR